MNIRLDDICHWDCECERCRRDRDGCRTVVNKPVEVRTPVEVDVRTRPGKVRIRCSEPQIIESTRVSSKCSGKCTFTVKQLICVEIPISYKVRTDIRDSYVDCDVDME